MALQLNISYLSNCANFCVLQMEYEKRYLAELYRPVAIANGASALRLQPTGPQLLRMSNQVKEVLPNVPLDAIRRDLGKKWKLSFSP